MDYLEFIKTLTPDMNAKSISPIYQVDAFTNKAFSGNPAAVCYLMQPKPTVWMQEIAAEMNLSETAFFQIKEKVIELRWFTPKLEVDLCGHATLATAHIIWETGLIPESRKLCFDTRSGVLFASKKEGWIELDFPAQPATQAVDAEHLAHALGVTPKFVGRNKSDILVEIESEHELNALVPDMEALEKLPARGVIVTCLSEQNKFDFVSRFFAPAVGVPEDPVTGSAHCCLGPYWAEKLGRNELMAYQASPRGGEIKVIVEGARCKLQGQAVTIMQGILSVYPELV